MLENFPSMKSDLAILILIGSAVFQVGYNSEVVFNRMETESFQLPS